MVTQITINYAESYGQLFATMDCTKFRNN